MYDTGKIFKAGGTSKYADNPSNNRTYRIDITGGPVKVTKLSPMIYQRGYANGPVLPDGKIAIIGGQTYMKEFSDSDAVLPAEMFDPEAGTSTLMAPIAVARNYHSFALLLPDARVLSAGGGLTTSNISANHPDLQLFSPPYLFDSNGNEAVRPRILSAPAFAGIRQHGHGDDRPGHFVLLDHPLRRRHPYGQQRPAPPVACHSARPATAPTRSISRPTPATSCPATGCCSR